MSKYNELIEVLNKVKFEINKLEKEITEKEFNTKMNERLSKILTKDEIPESNPYILKTENTKAYSLGTYGIQEHYIQEDEDIEYMPNRYNSITYARLRQKEIDLEDKLRAFSYINNWEDHLSKEEDIMKFTIMYDNEKNKLTYVCANYIDGDYLTEIRPIYFTTEEAVKKAIEIFGDEIIQLMKERAEYTRKGE